MQQSVRLAALSLLALAGCAHEVPIPDLQGEGPAPGQRVSLTQQSSSLPGTTYKLVYRSQDALDPHKLVLVSAKVLLPPGAPPAGGWPVLAWAHGTTGLAITCAPSVQGIGVRQSEFYRTWLNHGFAVVATDYAGMGQPGHDLYLNARSEGAAVLDGVRAARSAIAGVGQDVVIDGHSQGAQAAIAAAGMAPDYAPTLHIRGTIAVAPPYFNDDSGRTLFGTGRTARQFSPNVVYGLMLGASLGSADPSFDPQQAFRPRALAFYRRAQEECLGDFYGAVDHAGLTPANTFTPDAAQALGPALAWGRYPTLHLTQPLLLAIGTADIQIAPAEQKRLGADLCAAGTSVALHTYPGQGHSGALEKSMPDALRFAHAALSGDVGASTCR
jgi:hypothetical protein